MIPGPDFPTGGVLVEPREAIVEAYRTGRGSFRLRARWQSEDLERGQYRIVVTEIPYQVHKARLVERITELLEARKLALLADVRDESAADIRLVLEPKSRTVEPELLMETLFRQTDLETRVGLNMNVLDAGGTPRVMNLREVLQAFLDHRHEVLVRRTRHRLGEIARRLEILAGYLVVYANLDGIIRIIREEDEPKPVLMKRFKLSDVQAEAILELKLRHLARLEEIRIKGEQKDLNAEKADLEKTLKSKVRLTKLVKAELEAVAQTHGDERRTKLEEREPAQAISETELVTSEPVTVVLSQRGWARAAKGHEVDPETLSYRSGDGFLAAALGRSNQQSVFVDSTGRAYTLATHTLPSARGQGEPLTKHFNPPDGASFRAVLVGQPEDRWVLASAAGYGFVVKLEDLYSRNKSGKAVLRVPQGSTVIPAAAVGERGEWIAAASTDGRLLVFALEELPELSKGKGNKIIGLPSKGGVSLASLCVVREVQALRIRAGKREMTIKAPDVDYYLGNRGNRGLALPRGWRNVERLSPVAD